MLKPFATLHENATIWIYQAERTLSELEKTIVSHNLNNFVENWDSHGAAVSGSFQIQADRFVIVAAEQIANMVSGCSIDKLTHTIQFLEKELNLSLMDRKIVFINDNNLESASLKNFKTLLSEQTLTGETLIFDTTIKQKSQIENHFKVSVSNSFAKNFVPVLV